MSNKETPALLMAYSLRHAADEHASRPLGCGLLWVLLPAREAGRDEETKEDKEKEDER